MRRVLPALVVLLCAMATTTACGDDSDDGGTSEPKVIEITVSGDTVTPNGERIGVDVDQPVDLVVEADQPGEIHVHSTPEQELTYEAGTETFKLSFDRPGIVEVESHTLDKIIVQLEVE